MGGLGREAQKEEIEREGQRKGGGQREEDFSILGCNSNRWGLCCAHTHSSHCTCLLGTDTAGELGEEGKPFYKEIGHWEFNSKATETVPTQAGMEEKPLNLLEGKETQRHQAWLSSSF